VRTALAKRFDHRLVADAEASLLNAAQARA
jgi:hypothetical protein